MCDCDSNCGCSDCQRDECCPIGYVAVYDECGKFAGCLSPEEAKDYNNSKIVPPDTGYAKVIDPVTGEYVGNFTPADLPAVIAAITPDMYLVMKTSNVKCNGDSTGTASVQIIGGVAPYTIDYGGDNPAALAAGSYTVTVTDNNGLTASAQFTIVEPDPIVINATTSPDSGSGDGTASANPTGGTSPYTYDWRDNLGNPIGQTSRTATGLTAGTYQVFVTDFNGCVKSDLNVIVS